MVFLLKEEICVESSSGFPIIHQNYTEYTAMSDADVFYSMTQTSSSTQ